MNIEKPERVHEKEKKWCWNYVYLMCLSQLDANQEHTPGMNLRRNVSNLCSIFGFEFCIFSIKNEIRAIEYYQHNSYFHELISYDRHYDKTS